MAAHGPEAVTLRALGKELGLVPSGVYRYYPSRKELLSAVAGDLYADLLARLTEAAGPLPPGPRALRALAAAYRE
ncbi:TetR/AcrR family transcriptional regulator, partial [Streptomyces nanhaiensis]